MNNGLARFKAWPLQPWFAPLVWALGLLPLAHLIWGAIQDTLGPNPAEALIRGSGDWTLRLLCLTLAVTPVRRWLNWPALIRQRRHLGLLTFTWATLHALAYGWLDMGLDLSDILHDLPKRPFALVGFTAWLILWPLALTSSHAMIRWMGGARWQALHRGVYVVAVLAILHFFWMRASKNNLAEVAVYAAILGGLLLWRLKKR